MNQQTRLEIARIVETYVPAHHFNLRRKLGQDLARVWSMAHDEGYKEHRDYIYNKGFWWRLWYVLL